MSFEWLTDLENPFASQDVEHLLGIVVLVPGWCPSGFDDGDEDLTGCALGAVHDQFVGVGREAIAANLAGVEHEALGHGSTLPPLAGQAGELTDIGYPSILASYPLVIHEEPVLADGRRQGGMDT